MVASLRDGTPPPPTLRASVLSASVHRFELADAPTADTVELNASAPIPMSETPPAE